MRIPGIGRALAAGLTALSLAGCAGVPARGAEETLLWEIPFVAFDDARAGRPLAILFSYGCHPVVPGPGNTKASADRPGHAARALEGATGARAAIPTAAVRAELRVRARPDREERCAPRLVETPEGRRLLSEVQVLRLGDLALVSAPGELLVESGLAIRNTSPLPHPMAVSCANDHLGYLVTERIWREGGHEAASALSADVEKPLLEAARETLRRAKEEP